MTRPTLESALEFDPLIQRGLKFGTVQVGNIVNYVVNVKQNTIIVITPTAAQNVLLPLESTAAGLVFIIANASAGAFALTLQTSVGGALPFGGAVLTQNESALVFCDGIQWRAITAAGVMTAP